MKRVIALSLLLNICIVSGFAQVSLSNYSFSQENLTYNELSGPGIEVLWSGSIGSHISEPISIPEFFFNGEVYTTVYVSSNGFITFGEATVTANYSPISSGGSYAGAVSAFATNLVHNNISGIESSVKYQQLGDEFIVQWTDIRRYMSSGGERISFQIRLNTADASIRIVYGDPIVPGTRQSYPQVGLRGASNTEYSNRTISAGDGNWINSTAGTANDQRMYFLDNEPATVPSGGLTFKWEAPDITAPPEVTDLLWPHNGLLTSAKAVHLEWTEVWSASPLLGYKVYLGTDPNPSQLIYDGLDFSYATTNLDYNSTYYWKVVPYNDNGDATDVEIWSFSTVEESHLAESFEDVWFPPLGWQHEPGWIQDSSNSLDGLKSARKYTHPNAENNKLQTPKLIITANSQLSFFAKTTAVTPQQVQVYYSSDKLDWSAVGDEVSLIPGNWEQYNTDLGSLAGNNYYLGIAAYHGTGGSPSFVYFDHFTGPEVKDVVPAPAQHPIPANQAEWIPAETTLLWNPGLVGGIPSGYKIYLGTDGGGTSRPTDVINGQLVTQPSFNTPALNTGTTYYWQVVPVNDAGEAEDCPIWSFSTFPHNGIQIGFDDNLDINLPFYPLYRYSYSQNIYLQSEINNEIWITDLFYHWDGWADGEYCKDWVIYLGHTNKTEFTNNQDWLAVADMIKVFDGEVNLPSNPDWVQIPLHAPFLFNNEDNLVIAVDQNTFGWSYGRFFGSETLENRGILRYSDIHNPDPENPPIATTLVEGIANLRIQFSETEPDPIAHVDPLYLTFEQVLVDETSDILSVVIQNLGGGQLIIDGMEIIGDDPDDFEIVSSHYSYITIPTYESITVEVAFTPTSKGTRNAILELDNSSIPGSVAQIPLHGIGVPVDPPDNFTATAAGIEEILLEWNKNVLGNGVIIAHNMENKFGETIDGEMYEVGEELPGGGTIIYIGDADSFVHEDVAPNAGHFYKAWSITENNKYSLSVETYGTPLCSTVFDIPLFENFEGIPEKRMPVCWSTIIETFADRKHWIGASDEEGYSSLVFHNDYEVFPTLIAITPELNADINELFIEFSMVIPLRKSDNMEEGITVGVISDPTDLDTFEPLNTYYGDWNVQSKLITHYFHQYNGTAKHIALKANFSMWSMHKIFVPNILIDYRPSCMPPEEIEADNITLSSVDISWTPGFEENQWYLIYGPTGFDPTSVGTTVPIDWDPEYTIENLGHSTQYDVYVQAKCGINDLSKLTGPLTFTTLCEATPEPIVENFDTTPEGELPPCWSAITNNNGSIETTANHAFSMPHSVKMDNYAMGSEGIILVSPEMVNDVQSMYLKFFARNVAVWGSPVIEVGTIADKTDFDSFNHLQTFPVSNQWEEHFFLFDEYEGSDPYIAFRLAVQYARVVLDNIIIEVFDECLRPVAFHVVSAEAESVVLDWTPGYNEENWDLMYGLPGFSPEAGGLETKYVDHHPYTLDGLEPGTSYDVYLRSYCSTYEQSPWVGPLPIKTLPCYDEDKCTYTVQLIDSWGDGWDGTVLGFRQDGLIVATFGEDFTNGSEFGPVEVPLCPGEHTEIVVVNLGWHTEEKGFSVYDPDGELVFEREPGQTFTASTIFHTFYSDCGNDEEEGVPEHLEVMNESVLDGEEECYNAEQTIVVAGNGNYFTVHDGGSATLIAGHNIVMLPGTTIEQGAYFNAYITTDGTFCQPPKAIVAADDERLRRKLATTFDRKDETVPVPFTETEAGGLSIRVFPNPSQGVFNLEIMDDGNHENIKVEVYSLVGIKVLDKQVPGAGLHQFDLSGHERGLYLLRVSSGHAMQTLRLLKQ